MLEEPHTDSQHLTAFLPSTHETCDKYSDVATASLIENWIDRDRTPGLVLVGNNK
jgi:starvation-inducible DNA-binding protein